MDKNDLKFRDFSNILISGCTQSGKTEFTKKLLMNANEMFITPPQVCVFSYTHWQPVYEQLQEKWGDNITFMEELPNEETLREIMTGHQHGIFVVDDKASEMSNGVFFMDLLSRMGHHLKMSNVVLVQDPSLSGKMKSVLTKNFHVNVMMRSPRDRNYIRSLGIMLNDYKCLIEAYDDACEGMFGYLVLDCHPLSNPALKYRTKVFPQDDHCIVYRSKKK